MGAKRGDFTGSHGVTRFEDYNVVKRSNQANKRRVAAVNRGDIQDADVAKSQSDKKYYAGEFLSQQEQKTLSKRMEAERKRQGLKLNVIRAAVGIDKFEFRKIQSFRVLLSMQQARTIADTLGVSVDWLIGNEI